MKTTVAATLLLTAGLHVGIAAAAEYSPLTPVRSQNLKTVDLTVKDAGRNREIPLRVYLPPSTKGSANQAAPVVLFSHGLGGSCKNSPYLGKHWSGRGYVVVFMQHHGSDESVWKDVPVTKRLAAMRQATTIANTIDRFKDVTAVLDQLAIWHKEEKHPLSKRLDLARTGMSGHSYGAVTTQAVCGQNFGRLAGQRFTDKRLRAAVAFSPSSPRRGNADQAFGSVKVPWMLMTGTKDTSPINNSTAESRLAVYPAVSNKVDKYEILLHNAEHSAFSDRALPGDREARNPNHHKVILALSTAFWDTYLRNDNAARKWLQSEKAKTITAADDRWRFHLAE